MAPSETASHDGGSNTLRDRSQRIMNICTAHAMHMAVIAVLLASLAPTTAAHMDIQIGAGEAASSLK